MSTYLFPPGAGGRDIFSKAGSPPWPWTKGHLLAAVCYVSLNPVRARLVGRAEDWPWSSFRAHLAGVEDEWVTVGPVLARTPGFPALLADENDDGFTALRRAEGSGRPVGAAEFVSGLERVLGRPIARRAPGRKPNGVVTRQLDLPL